jgi:hypothetical protein
MTFNHLNRRTHLYLALILMPWFLMYGVSSIPFSHQSWLGDYYKDGVQNWKLRFDQTYERVVDDKEDLRASGRSILSDLGLEGAFGINRRNNRVTIYLFDFWSSVRVTYNLQKKWIKVEDKRFRWDHFITGLHARGGFQQDNALNDAWAVIVDLVCLSFVVWIASGIYMWWLLGHTRAWGWVALLSGVVTFIVFLLNL